MENSAICFIMDTICYRIYRCDRINNRVPEEKQIFKELSKIELGIQAVEFVYYFNPSSINVFAIS